MNFMIYFWSLFMYVMTFGLPFVIYYASGMWKDNEPGQSAGMAFFFLGLGCLLWIVLFFTFAKKFLFSQFKKKAKGAQLLAEGKKVQGTILSRQVLGSRNNGDFLLLEIEFTNLADAVVTTRLDLLDTEPQLMRFEKGHSIPLIIDPAPEDPSVMIMGKGFKWNRAVLVVVSTGLLLIGSAAAALLLFGYLYESRGYGWRYLHFWHPFILVPLIGIFELGLFIMIFNKLLGKRGSGRLTVYGQSAEASIVSAARTGLTINDQPQVKVTVAFEDTRGRACQASFKKIVDLLDLHTFTAGSKIKILYDAGNPAIVEPIG